MNCDICGKLFRLKSSLVRHQRKYHGIEPDSDRRKKLCPELNCSFSCFTQAQLRNHVLDIHKIAVKKIELEFSTWKDFEEWKDKEEDLSISKFTKRGGDSKNVNGYIKKWFLCHRSGIFKSRSSGLRELKSQGSCKMGSTCTASIEAEESSQSINVVYHNTHFGHLNEIYHITLTESERKFLKNKLDMGIKPRKILEDVRANISGTGMNRLKLLTRHDLSNIMASNNLQESHAYENDAISEDEVVFVEEIDEMNSMNYVEINEEPDERFIDLTWNHPIILEKTQMFVDLLKSKPLPSEKYHFVEKKLEELLSLFINTGEKNKASANKNFTQKRRLKDKKIKIEKINKPTLGENLNSGENIQQCF